jgi:hypothetical protein
MWIRRVFALAVVLAAAGALIVVLHPSATKVTRYTLAHLKIPVDEDEREWRAKLEKVVGKPGVTTRDLERKVARAVARSGTTVVRMKIWPRPATVELVVATTMDPARFVVFRLTRFSDQLPPDAYFKVVDGGGREIVKVWAIGSRSGSRSSFGMRHDLLGCYPVVSIPGHLPPPCPVKMAG